MEGVLLQLFASITLSVIHFLGERDLENWPINYGTFANHITRKFQYKTRFYGSGSKIAQRYEYPSLFLYPCNKQDWLTKYVSWIATAHQFLGDSLTMRIISVILINFIQRTYSGQSRVNYDGFSGKVHLIFQQIFSADCIQDNKNQ